MNEAVLDVGAGFDVLCRGNAHGPNPCRLRRQNVMKALTGKMEKLVRIQNGHPAIRDCTVTKGKGSNLSPGEFRLRGQTQRLPECVIAAGHLDPVGIRNKGQNRVVRIIKIEVYFVGTQCAVPRQKP